MTTGTTGATIREPAAGSRGRPSAGMMVSRLLRAGCTAVEASNLAGLAVGLGPVASGWSVREIERLRFLQHLDASGQLQA